jgi:hypothetical protein
MLRLAFSLSCLALLVTPSLARPTSDRGPTPEVRDHRDEPKVRDHRDEPKVRDHRTAPASKTSAPAVRDHRSESVAIDVDDDSRVSERSGPVRVPWVMLPMKLDLGAAGTATSRGRATGMAGSLGIHWASLAPRPTDTDVGIGVFGSLMSTDNHEMEESAVKHYGGYIELGRTLSRGSYWRTWASGRGEYLASRAFGGDTHTGFGASGRLSVELYANAAHADRAGAAVGSWAIGLYVEAAVRDTVEDAGKLHASTGMTLRTPFVLAL